MWYHLSMATPLVEQIHVRPWEDADFPNAVILNREAEEHIGIGSESGDWRRDMVGISETFAGSGGEFLVGHLEAEMVVMGGFKRLSQTIAEVKRMRVTPQLQGQRIGPWFLGILEADMKNIGLKESAVSTLSTQTAALKLYSRAGYFETGREELTDGPEKGFVVVSFSKNFVSDPVVVATDKRIRERGLSEFKANKDHMAEDPDWHPPKIF